MQKSVKWLLNKEADKTFFHSPPKLSCTCGCNLTFLHQINVPAFYFDNSTNAEALFEINCELLNTMSQMVFIRGLFLWCL